MRDHTRILPAKAWLFPDMRVLWWGGAQAYEMRTFIVHVPRSAIQSYASGNFHVSHQSASAIESINLHLSLWLGLQLIINECPRCSREAVRRSRPKEADRLLSCLTRHLLERRYVIEDINSSAIS